MKVIIVLCLLARFSLCQTLNRCMPYFLNEKIAYSLVAMDISNENKNYEVPMSNFTDEKIQKSVDNATVFFKLCTAATAPPGCQNVPEAIAYFKDGSDCKVLSVLTSEIENNLIMTNGSISGVSIGYNSANVDGQAKAQVRYNVKFEVTCDRSVTKGFQWSTRYQLGYIVLSTKSLAGCSFGISDILDIFQSNKYICFPIFILTGLILTFFGRNSFKWTLLICGFLIGFLAVAGTCYSFGLFVEATTTKKYTILGIAILVGIIGAIALCYFESTALALACGSLTALIVKAVMTLFIPTFKPSSFVEMAILLGSALLGGMVANCFRE